MSEVIQLSKAYRNCILEVVTESLESIGFMEVQQRDDVIPYDENLQRLRADILVNEPLTGEIRLIMGRKLAVSIVENAYVIDPEEITDVMIKDLMAEIINVIAGNLLRHLVSDDEIFVLGIPEVGEDVFLKIDTSSNIIQFDMEGEPFWLMLIGEMFTSPKYSL